MTTAYYCTQKAPPKLSLIKQGRLGFFTVVTIFGILTGCFMLFGFGF